MCLSGYGLFIQTLDEVQNFMPKFERILRRCQTCAWRFNYWTTHAIFGFVVELANAIHVGSANNIERVHLMAHRDIG